MLPTIVLLTLVDTSIKSYIILHIKQIKIIATKCGTPLIKDGSEGLIPMPVPGKDQNSNTGPIPTIGTDHTVPQHTL